MEKLREISSLRPASEFKSAANSIDEYGIPREKFRTICMASAMLYFTGQYFTMENIPWNYHGKRFPCNSMWAKHGRLHGMSLKLFKVKTTVIPCTLHVNTTETIVSTTKHEISTIFHRIPMVFQPVGFPRGTFGLPWILHLFTSMLPRYFHNVLGTTWKNMVY